MAKFLTVDGFLAAKTAIKEASSGRVYVLFTGTKDAAGKSWCPDCVTADPVIERRVAKLESRDITFITCHVGGRDYWKDQNNDFRKDPQFKLKSVPTLMRIGSPKRLEEAQCANDDLVAMLFEEED